MGSRLKVCRDSQYHFPSLAHFKILGKKRWEVALREQEDHYVCGKSVWPKEIVSKSHPDGFTMKQNKQKQNHKKQNKKKPETIIMWMIKNKGKKSFSNNM